MYTEEYRYTTEEYMMQSSIMDFMYRVYGWMATALAVSAGVAYYVTTQPTLQAVLFKSPGLLFGLLIVQLILVGVLSFLLLRMSYTTAIVLFLIYAASLGLTLSSLFLVYTTSSIFLTFGVTAGMFGIMGLYGYFTKTDLTALRNVMIMALLGLILGFLVNMFWQNSTFDYVLSGIGVIVFTLLIAADTQKIKELGYRLLSTHETMKKVAVLGAMMLYLDFLNLFLMLLSFLGNKRQN